MLSPLPRPPLVPVAPPRPPRVEPPGLAKGLRPPRVAWPRPAVPRFGPVAPAPDGTPKGVDMLTSFCVKLDVPHSSTHMLTAKIDFRLRSCRIKAATGRGESTCTEGVRSRDRVVSEVRSLRRSKQEISHGSMRLAFETIHN